MPVIAQTFLQLGLHFKPWGLLPYPQEDSTVWSFWKLYPGILPTLTCLILSSLEILLTSFGALIFAPLCGCAPLPPAC